MANGIKQRTVKDNVIRGNRDSINNLILKLKNSNYFFKIVINFFDDKMRMNYLKNDYLEKISNRFLEITQKENTYIDKLLNKIDLQRLYTERKRMLLEIIFKTNSRKKVIELLISNFKTNNYLIAEIIDEETIIYVLNEILELKSKNELIDKDIERFRNYIGNTNSRKIAEELENHLVSKGIKFDEKTFTEKDVVEYKKKYKIHIQDNIDILFDKPRLLKEIKKVFNANKNSLIIDDLGILRNKWYDKNGHGNTIDTSLSIINDYLLNYRRPVNYNMLKEYLDDEYTIIKKFKSIIKLYNSRSIEYKKNRSKQYIIDWCNRTSQEIDFDKILEVDNNGNTFYQKEYYNKFNTIFFFQNLYSIVLSKDFLLNSIQFYRHEDFNYDKEINGLELLKKLVNDDIAFDKVVIENINTKELFSISKSKHIEYAINNRLTEVYNKIKEYFINDNSLYGESEKILKFIKISGDNTFLKDCCKDINSHVCWTAIDIIMLEKIDNKFCEEKSLEYINSDETLFRDKALQILITLNEPIAIDIFINSFRKDKPYSTDLLKLDNYDCINDFEKLEELYNIVYNVEHSDFDRNFYHSFFRSIIINLSVKDNKIKKNYERVNAFLEEIRLKLSNQKEDLFYINLLISDSTNSYINSNSKEMSFKEALHKVNGIMA